MSPARRSRKKQDRPDRPIILAVGDGVVPTGFARVLHSLIGRLKDRWDFHHLALNYEGGPHTLDWTVYPAGSEGDFFGGNRIRSLVETIQPQLVFLLNDPWVLGRYLEPLQEIRKDFKIVAYAPVDAGPLDLSLVEPLCRLDSLVLYTEYGRRQIEEAFAPLRRKVPDLPFPEVCVIPHGVDTDLFRPLPDAGSRSGRQQAREQLFPGPGHFRDDFIVLNANRNQPRKRIDITLKGFAEFARDKPEGVRLYLHMGVEDCGWNIVTLARRLGIEDRLILTAEEPYLPAVADEVLNLIYNACDAGINTSIGEGWGLVNLEHAATGAAQIVPRHSACEEIWSGSALLLEPSFSLTSERILTEGWIVSPGEVARALEALYADAALRAEMSAAAFRTATQPGYQWSTVAETWDRHFRAALDGSGSGHGASHPIKSSTEVS